MNRNKGAWSYIAGEKGRNRVRAFIDERTERIFLEVRLSGRKRRFALGHRDKEAAKQQAEELALKLRRPEVQVREDTTLAKLFDNYLREVTPLKGVVKQKHDRATATLITEVVGANRLVSSLGHRDAARFVSERRRRGDQRCGKRKAKPIRDRVIGYDLQFFIAVLNWGVRGGLLDRNPLHGFPIPRERSPRRPIVTEKQYQALLEAASTIDPVCRLAVVLAHETGHRIGAIRLLRWSDLEFSATAQRIRWRAENDKSQFEHVTPLSAAAVLEIEKYRRERPAIGDAWVLPSPTEPSQSVSRHLVRDWWEQMQKAAKLPEEPGRGWHSLRRKFATELKHVPLKDLSYLGGWKDHQTLLSCYQRADEATMTDALKNRVALGG